MLAAKARPRKCNDRSALTIGQTEGEREMKMKINAQLRLFSLLAGNKLHLLNFLTQKHVFYLTQKTLYLFVTMNGMVAGLDSGEDFLFFSFSERGRFYLSTMSTCQVFKSGLEGCQGLLMHMCKCPIVSL